MSFTHFLLVLELITMYLCLTELHLVGFESNLWSKSKHQIWCSPSAGSKEPISRFFVMGTLGNLVELRTERWKCWAQQESLNSAELC